ncbi:MAG: VOC family protein [Dehalococcoidia bacterium]|nr:VOC family protein [Dehalococcoidia bacterium]
MFKRIDHVEIVPTNMDKAIAFYTDILGFKVRSRRKMENPPMLEIAYLELKDTLLEVISVKNAAPLTTAPYQIGYRMMAIEVEDMDKAVEYLKSKGVPITRGPVLLGTSKRAEIKDPDGISIELRQW